MPNNCSTLIQRKQNTLHKVIRTNSEGKLQNAVSTTTSELHVKSNRKLPTYSPSTNHLINDPTVMQTIRRSTLFSANRIQPAHDQIIETHLPTIRDTIIVERPYQLYDEPKSQFRPRTPVTSASPKHIANQPSASLSSIFNTLSKRSTENLTDSHGDIYDRFSPIGRHSRRTSNESNKYGNSVNHTPTKQQQATTPQKYSRDSGVDTRYSLSPPETSNKMPASTLTNRILSAASNLPNEVTTIHDTARKDRTATGPLYQRRTNNAVKAPIKQKIDKFRRRSEESTHAINGNSLMHTANVGLSVTTPVLSMISASNGKHNSSLIPNSVRRVTSDAEIQARLEVIRLSTNTNITQLQSQTQQSQRSTRNRLKSPYLYSTHQQLARPTSPQTPSASQYRHRQQTPSAPQRQMTGTHNQRQQQSNGKQSATTGQGNLYLAFIASRHLSTLEDTLYQCDMDHPKLLRIFTWLKNVEEHRHEQSDHEKLLIEQNQRMLEKEDDLSLFSEIQYAVDEIPPNTSGKPCEKIPVMDFDK